MAADSFATRVARGARAGDDVNEPVSLPIYQAAGWVFDSLEEVDAVYEGRVPGTIYGGSGVPNHAALEALICSLHGAQSAIVTAAGMSALTAIVLQIARAGSRVVVANDVYGNTLRLLDDMKKFDVRTEAVSFSDLDEVERALQTQADLLITETVSNPRVRVADLSALARIAHERRALLVVDNTLASPYHCQPLALGADIVFESVTKFLGGHHDVVLGVVAGGAEVKAMRPLASRAGLISSAFDTWLAVRSIATLGVRLQRSSATALRLAQWLAAQPKIQAVHYPGLAGNSAHDVARRTLQNGFGSVVSFELADRAAVERLLAGLRIIRLVLTFGGVQTTLSHPATSSHRSLTPEQRRAVGIHDGFIRLSIGVEDPDDLIADFERGLAAV